MLTSTVYISVQVLIMGFGLNSEKNPIRLTLMLDWDIQYLNCKILHCGTLLQLRPNFSQNYVIPSPQLKCFFPGTRWRPKKKVFTAIWDYIRPEFVGFIRAGWLLIVSSSSAQISMGGRLNLHGGTLNLDGGTLTFDGGTRPPYNLSTRDIHYVIAN